MCLFVSANQIPLLAMSLNSCVLRTLGGAKLDETEYFGKGTRFLFWRRIVTAPQQCPAICTNNGFPWIKLKRLYSKYSRYMMAKDKKKGETSTMVSPFFADLPEA